MPHAGMRSSLWPCLLGQDVPLHSLEKCVARGCLGIEVSLVGDEVARVDGFVDEFIAALVEFIAGVALDPFPNHLVLGLSGVEALPEVFVEDWLFVGLFPALFLPVGEPVFVQSIDDVFGIRVKHGFARFAQEFQCADGRHQLHAIVRGVPKGSVELLLKLSKDENSSESSGSGVSPSSSIGVNYDRFHREKMKAGNGLY